MITAETSQIDQSTAEDRIHGMLDYMKTCIKEIEENIQDIPWDTLLTMEAELLDVEVTIENASSVC